MYADFGISHKALFSSYQYKTTTNSMFIIIKILYPDEYSHNNYLYSCTQSYQLRFKYSINQKILIKEKNKDLKIKIKN